MGIVRTCAREILANVLMGIPPIARLRSKTGRTSGKANERELRTNVLSFILDYPIQPLIPGARIMEIGPGDHLATGLALLAYGAKSYAAMDRFQGDYRSDSASRWYALVRDQWSSFFPDRPWPKRLSDFPDLAATIPFSTEESEHLPSCAFDLVLSKAVGEHVRDIDQFSAATHQMLAPGGTALHVVDFSSHGIFAPDPMKFLTVSERTWHMMGSNRGLPNRKRLHEFEAAFSMQPFSRVEVIRRSTTNAPIPPSLAHIPEDSARTTWAAFLLKK